MVKAEHYLSELMNSKLKPSAFLRGTEKKRDFGQIAPCSLSEKAYNTIC